MGIVNAIFEPGDAEWYHHYKIVNIQKPSKQLKGLELLFLELPKFKPITKNEKSLRVLWLRFLSELDESTKTVPLELLAIPEINEACELSEEAAFTAGELEAYHKYWDGVRTYKTLLSGAESKGRLERGIEIAKNLISLNLLPQDISTATGLSLAEIDILIRSTLYSSPVGK